LSLAVKIKTGKFERIPARYSEELYRVVSWMLCQNSIERPTVDDLMNLPQVSLRIREKKMVEVQMLVKKKEDELKAREEKINEKEQAQKERD
jgi:NIMA (never in mitosis gene a)-related kinase